MIESIFDLLETSVARIDYNEFLKIVLSWNNSDLRTSAVLRPNADFGGFKLLPSSVEASLSALIAKETEIFDALYVPFVSLQFL